jgi:hypothetical protein
MHGTCTCRSDLTGASVFDLKKTRTTMTLDGISEKMASKMSHPQSKQPNEAPLS